ncbi:fumarate hydratase [Alkalibacter mobilis]|uniref:fumarate hydratase n=1 Tax=Alkalibacter mobilis TaxID=2787712 RepID=UPI00189E178F|nr:fumarate hydratase [Alkalibacter mobilis]MBF7096098.1 fumarate hydratase [Alkalibacter mobilis]
MVRINVEKIKQAVYDSFLEINCKLSQDVTEAICTGFESEESPIGRAIFDDILKNNSIALEKQIPICQDTGMAVVWVKAGQEVALVGGNLNDAINQGVREAYKDGYFRNSIVSDPLNRINTKDNTPAVIHYEIVEGNHVEIIVSAKGFGSENMSSLKMLKPSDGLKGVIDFIVETVTNAGPNACPPFFIGVGIGGTMEKCALMSKQALMRDVSKRNADPFYEKLEKDLIKTLNGLGIGPMGLGGTSTVLGLNIEVFPTHIAGLPVAVNMCCHVNRHAKTVIRGEIYD